MELSIREIFNDGVTADYHWWLRGPGHPPLQGAVYGVLCNLPSNVLAAVMRSVQHAEKGLTPSGGGGEEETLKKEATPQWKP